MKKILSILFLSVMIFSCSNQQQEGAAVVKKDDKLTNNAINLLKNYVENNFSLWEELLSDDCEVLFNNVVVDKNSMIEGLKRDHILFKSLTTSDEYVHTNYFKNGQIWTNHWFTNTATGNFTGETTSARVHTDLKWENGKVVRFQAYYDPTLQIKEATAMAEMSK